MPNHAEHMAETLASWPSGREQFVGFSPLAPRELRHRESALIRMFIEDGIGRIDEAVLVTPEVGVVAFRQYLDGPDQRVCVFMDSAVSKQKAQDWLASFTVEGDATERTLTGKPQMEFAAGSR